MTRVTAASSLSPLVGGKTAKSLEAAFGYTSVLDLLEHYPRRYATRGELTQLDSLPIGETVTVVAEILDVRERSMKGKRGGLLEVRITDGIGELTLTFFNQAWRARDLQPGRRGMFAGKVGEYKGAAQLAHPAYELFDDAQGEVSDSQAQAAAAWAARPIPIYSATSSVTSWTIARAVALVLAAVAHSDELYPDEPALKDPVDEQTRLREHLLPHSQAMRDVHQPATKQHWREARRTLRFTEAYLLQLALIRRKHEHEAQSAVRRPRAEAAKALAMFDAQLPFELTEEQRSVGEVIADELEREHPMHRLLQGEVGSGKTIVAVRAMLQAAGRNAQAALLAPTEVLAAQHYRSLTQSLGEALSEQYSPVLLTGQMAAAEKKHALNAVASGQARLVVGTHALMSEATKFHELALIVIDEQHRFGVEQREQLRVKAAQPPHVLVMTATPIPRTIALTAFSDLDVSTITRVPPGRAEIESHAVLLAEHPGWLERVYQRAAEEIAAGRQVYFVCPAIDSEEAVNVTDELNRVRQHPLLSQVSSASLTGQMPAVEKERVMVDFASGSIDLLVATTVIEVGVDVPNASLMVVFDADRFGVSQLHQLRGRVGRGGVPGVCLLVSSAEVDSLAAKRVQTVAATSDGFALAEADLEFRQEGDVLGEQQSGGRSTLRLLRVAKDRALIEAAHLAAVDALSHIDSVSAATEAAIERMFAGREENISKS